MTTRRNKLTRNGGFTLLEVMMASSVLLVVLGMMYGAALSMALTVRQEDSAVTLNAEARNAMEIIARNLRQSQLSGLTTVANGATVTLGANAVTNIGFSRVADTNNNGNALNAAMAVETAGPFRIVVDTNDANGDGLSTTQLVRLNAANQVVEVIANHISPVVATGDYYDASNGGILFQNIGGSIQVTLILRHQANVDLPMMVVRLDEVVTPRN